MDAVAAAAVPAQVKLVSADKEVFDVSRDVAELSKTLVNILEDLDSDGPVPLPNVDSATLGLILAASKRRVDAGDNPAAFESWFAEEFVNTLTQEQVFNLVLGSNYLSNKTVLDASCTYVASLIKGKTPDEIRATFNIKNDFTPDEEAEIKRENAWAFN
jgi:S-phase kinase-associated protein 1